MQANVKGFGFGIRVKIEVFEILRCYSDYSFIILTASQAELLELRLAKCNRTKMKTNSPGRKKAIERDSVG